MQDVQDEQPQNDGCQAMGHVNRGELLGWKYVAVAQGPIGTGPGDPLESIGKYCKRRIIIKAHVKGWLLRDISEYGINHATLFPDLDGLAQELKFETMHLKSDYFELSNTKRKEGSDES